MYNHKNAKAKKISRIELCSLCKELMINRAKRKRGSKLDLSEPKHSCVNNCTRLLGMAKQKIKEIKMYYKGLNDD